jgi:ribose transport system substrate-binding protein
MARAFERKCSVKMRSALPALRLWAAFFILGAHWGCTLMKVVISVPDEENAYQRMQAADARAAAARLGLEIEILDARGQPIEQVQALFKAVHAEPRPKAALVEPVSTHMFDSIVSLIQKTAPLGVGWFILNAAMPGLDGLRAMYPDVPMTAVGSDQLEIGRMQGRQLRALFPSGGHVLCVNGPQASIVVQERARGLRESVGAALRLSAIDAQWTEESAAAVVNRWLGLKLWERTPIHAVAAQDDVMAKGARDAIRALPGDPMRDVRFLGIDGVADYGQRLVREGCLDATVIQRSTAGPALEQVLRWLTSGERPPARVVLPAESYPDMARLALRAR